ncbi:hypothetical protein [Lysinibacillus sp. CTST325]
MNYAILVRLSPILIGEVINNTTTRNWHHCVWDVNDAEPIHFH